MDAGLRARIKGFSSSVRGVPSRTENEDQPTGPTCGPVGRFEVDMCGGAVPAGETAVYGGQSGAETKRGNNAASGRGSPLIVVYMLCAVASGNRRPTHRAYL